MPSHLSSLMALSTLRDAALPDDIDAAPALLQLGRALQQSGYRFTTVTPLTHQRVNARPENAWAATLRDVFGWSRPFRKGTLPAHIEHMLHAADIATPQQDGWRSMLRASTLGPYLFFHSAFPTSEADAVFFGPDTYRFIRALELELAALAPRIWRAADIGCGAGPGAIAIAARCPQAEVLAIDINDAALQLTAVNAALAGTANVKPCHSDLLSEVEGSFDLIVSNPPYLVDRSQRAYRDGGGALGAALSLAIVDAAIARLTPDGTLLMYTGAAVVDGDMPFLLAVAERLQQAGCSWTVEEIDPDVFGEELDEPAYAGTERIAAIWLKVCKTQK
ncbi:MAG TPA: class I SAM-dependent methyltransferase [Oxalicibacterium sp.]|jgi:methylase of polypeptide subunit release factors|nr:class I SAM-dependent methyltransferase [Oxalicibacterium sp.]